MISSLSSRYFARLGLDPEQLDAGPTLAKLQAIHEAHLARIPFENASQHGAPMSACLDVEESAHKILDQNRGGFCFEVNGLLGHWLESELQYKVTRIPSIVHLPDIGFDHGMTMMHLLLIVDVSSDAGLKKYVVDVGFGEPALHPLEYKFGSDGDEVQITPDGMVSELRRTNDDVIQYWKIDDEWRPRLKWSYTVSVTSPSLPLQSFQPGLDLARDEQSLFHQKLICTRLTPTHKYTFTEAMLKITTPRFGLKSTKVRRELTGGCEEARQVLLETFGMPLASTEGLDLSKALEGNKDAWDRVF